MIEIKMTIEIPGLPEALSALASAIGKQPDADAPKAAPAANPTAPVQPVQTAPTTATAAPIPAAADAPATAAPTAPAAPAESYTLDALSRAGAALIDAGKMPQLLDLLDKYKVQAVTQLPKDAYSAFGAELKALGAQL